MSNATDTQYGGSAHGTTKSYIIGFILSIILTVIPYYLVVNHILASEMSYIVISVFAILQLLVQLVFFLHLGGESKPHWNLIAFVFTLFIIGILVTGSLWIMYNLNYNMVER
ncbi:MAG: cytochrome o ubiquinol oxidase subunit IV [Proteobacteria bacterium]|jgi:cytochrome o ubiquinol oxidase operon protein cyoD|nr:cytochrome o ubiquinol oxidase subunit IV [Pseudomonadota bacterium]